MCLKYNHYLAVVVVFFLASCSPPYILTKSNREEYTINDKIAVDSAIIKMYLPYKTAIDSEMSKVIGYTEVALVKQFAAPESLLGNFFADAVFNQARKIQANIDFVIPTTNGGLRNDIAKGEITVSDVFELIPFDNETLVFNLKGADVLQILKFIAESGGQPVAGLKMNIRNKLPENVFINGKKFDINKEYIVATADYLANGGNDTRGFSTPISKKVLGLKIRDALFKEVSDVQLAGKKINTKLDGRITKN